jgi:hypothetical protein
MRKPALDVIMTATLSLRHRSITLPVRRSTVVLRTTIPRLEVVD